MEWVHRAINHADRRPAVLHRYMRNKPGRGPGPGKKSKNSPNRPASYPSWPRAGYNGPADGVHHDTARALGWHPRAMALIAERAVKRKLEVIRDVWLQGET